MKKIVLLIFLYLMSFAAFSQSTWKEVYSEKKSHLLQCITFPDSLIGYAVGQGGRIVKTLNGGNSWDTIVSGTKQTLFYVCFSDKNIGYACGNSGTIIKTFNGGKTWNLMNTLTTDRLNIIIPIDNDTVFAFGERGRMLKTNDGGKKWQVLKRLTLYDISSAQFLNAKTGFFRSSTNDSN
jgi:photosystem II stability/assembly factor-like uncharacterized protein